MQLQQRLVKGLFNYCYAQNKLPLKLWYTTELNLANHSLMIKIIIIQINLVTCTKHYNFIQHLGKVRGECVCVCVLREGGREREGEGKGEGEGGRERERER